MRGHESPPEAIHARCRGEVLHARKALNGLVAYITNVKGMPKNALVKP